MTDVSKQRRTQYSSCDACRTSRVACNAFESGHRPGKRRVPGSCSRCSKKGWPCTFEWMTAAKDNAPRRSSRSNGHRSSGLTDPFVLWKPSTQADDVPSESTSLANSTQHQPFGESRYRGTPPKEVYVPLKTSDSVQGSPVPRGIDEAEKLLSLWSEHIFFHGLENLKGAWLGQACPLVATQEAWVSPARLFRELDALLHEQLTTNAEVHASRVLSEENDQNEKSLRLAICSYTAHWLPAYLQTNHEDLHQYEELIRDRWRATRRDMLRVINRMSYRSVLALYLFSITPLPVGLSEQEEDDGITGIVCNQTALMQVQQLRGRLRSVQFFGSGVLSWPGGITNATPKHDTTSRFLDDESRVYWAALTWDTAAAISLNFRSALSAGLEAASVESAWTLSRGYLVDSFHIMSKKWRQPGFEITDEIAGQIISATAICRNYTWRTMASLKQALREAVNEDDLQFTWRMVLESLEIFKTTIRPLLTNCARSLSFLTQHNRMFYYETTLHYYLGVLLLVDAIEMSHRSDLLPQLVEAKLDAEPEAFNVVKFGLESTFTARVSSDRVESNCRSIRALSFIAMDPIPHHVVALVQLIHKSISRKFTQGNIKDETHVRLSSTLLDALKQLPQSSKSVAAARQSLEQSLEASKRV